MKRTKNELLQSCIEQFEHIDSVNNNPTLNTTESLIREIKKAINYTHSCTELCDDKGHDFDKETSVCKRCNTMHF